LEITFVQNVAKDIGIPFVGMKLFKIAAAGIVKFAVIAGIGGNGIVRVVINAAMVSRSPVSIVAAPEKGKKGGL